MAANDIVIAGAIFPDVPKILLPVNGGGTAAYTDVSDTTAAAADVASGKYFYTSQGVKTEGTASGGGGTTWETVYHDTVSVVDWGDAHNYVYIPGFRSTYGDFVLGDTYRVTWNNVQYVVVGYWDSIVSDPSVCLGELSNEPFAGQVNYSGDLIFITNDSASTVFALTIEHQVSGGGSTLITKTITANGTYDAEDDDADGYSEVTVALPTGTAGTPTATKGSVSNHSISVTPSVTNTAGVISGGTINGTAVTVSASELVSGSETKTSNGTYDVTNLAQLVVNVSGGSGLVYETGTYTPASDTARPTISFANNHSTTPAFVMMSDTSSQSTLSNNSCVYFSFDDPYRAFNSGFPYSTSALRYENITYIYKGTGSSISSGASQTQYSSDNTSSSSSSYSRYWVTESNFKPYANSSSRYWRSGRTYKWIAVWAPTS